MFYKHTRLKGPAGEVLTAWLLESDSVVGNVLQLAQDELRRPWLVEAVSDQLMLKAQSRFQGPQLVADEAIYQGVPEAVLAKPRKTRGPAKLKSLPNGASTSV